ncbi:SRPBCC domain-containing protein [Rugosimonospora africana]|uniref:Toxin n=1 Tax=Rugosimonospora africana TaxID=556532 RepID=A0A8J3QVW6_9ACTN|nr:SRPBCC domain-containing protein [Rugosimonospora africana]GIH16790.1 toxin [Rugosimonospora africana]
MSEDRIERDTLIAAPLERVWSLVAEPGFWVSQEASIWAGDEAGLAGVVASEGSSTMTKNPNVGEVAVRVEKVEPPTYVAYRWSSAFPGQELHENNSTLVEFTLSAEGDKTRLRVVESGFAALAGSEGLREEAFRFNTEGWPYVFEAVRNRAEQAR